MPWKLQKVKGGWKVITKANGAPHSNTPLTKKKALAQLRALHANVKT